METNLNKIRSALDKLAELYAAQAQAAYQKNHLTEADHEMIRRGFAKWDAIKNLTLAEQVVIIKREKKDAFEVHGMYVQNDVKRSVAKPKPRKKSAVPPIGDADALSELHARINSLRKPGVE